MTTSSPRTAGHRQPERTTVNLVRTHRNQTEESVEYSADFGKLFVEDMTRLYLLSYFLTANHEMAERCFVCGFGDCIQGNLVFQKWARSWSRRTIIHNAIRMMSPHPGSTATSATVHLAAEDEPQRIPDENIAIDSALSLGTSERFVFVLSVLERYPDRDCSVFLGCSRNDVREGRVRAFRQLADFERRTAAPRHDLSSVA
jgi:hypothetical protein